MARVYKDDKSWFQDFKDQFKSLDGQPFKKKVEHFFTYYTRLTVAVIISVIVAASLIGTILYNRTPALISGIFYPATLNENGEALLKSAVAEKLGVDEKKYHIDISEFAADNESAEQQQAIQQAIIASIMSGSLDYLVMDEESFTGLISADDEDGCVLYELSDLLSEEEFTRLKNAGRIISCETVFSGNFSCLVNIDDSYLSELIGLSGSGNCLGVILLTKNPESVKTLLELVYWFRTDYCHIWQRKLSQRMPKA